MTLEITVHKNILIHILKDIYGDATVGPFLGFKGGTAVYLLYNLPRFSVDLDFDLLDSNKEEYIFEQIQKIIGKYGHIKEARIKRFSFFYLLSYENKMQNAYNIKVEINRRNFGSQYEVKSYLSIPMKVMVQEDMFAHKLVAMFERLGTTNRDIFDVWFFLKNNWALNEGIIRMRTNMSLQNFLEQCINSLSSMNNRSILSGLGELLNPEQKIWVKKHLLEETIFLLKLKIASLAN